MSSPKTSDPLSGVVVEMEAFCKEQQLQCFYGATDDSDLKNISWDREKDPDWRHFLLMAKALNVKLVYLMLACFKKSQIEKAIVELDESEKEIESFRGKVGLIAKIDLAFVHEGVFHVYRLSADWFEKFHAITELEADSDDEIEFDEDLIDELAEKLANHPRYGTCKNKSQRGYLLEEIAKEEVGDIPDWVILEAAEKVYFLKVKPKEDERLKKEVSRLRKEGLNLDTIAQKLGISRNRVSGLLAD